MLNKTLNSRIMEEIVGKYEFIWIDSLNDIIIKSTIKNSIKYLSTFHDKDHMHIVQFFDDNDKFIFEIYGCYIKQTEIAADDGNFIVESSFDQTTDIEDYYIYHKFPYDRDIYSFILSLVYYEYGISYKITINKDDPVTGTAEYFIGHIFNTIKTYILEYKEDVIIENCCIFSYNNMNNDICITLDSTMKQFIKNDKLITINKQNDSNILIDKYTPYNIMNVMIPSKEFYDYIDSDKGVYIKSSETNVGVIIDYGLYDKIYTYKDSLHVNHAYNIVCVLDKTLKEYIPLFKIIYNISNAVSNIVVRFKNNNMFDYRRSNIELCILDPYNRLILYDHSYDNTYIYNNRSNSEVMKEAITFNNDFKNNIGSESTYIKIFGENNSYYGITEIDYNDLEDINKYHYNYNRSGTGKPPYASTKINGNTVGLHRIIMKDENEDNNIIDHKDRNVYNNKRNNLRISSKQTNASNSGLYSNNTLGLKGIRYSNSNGKNKKYMPRIRYNDKTFVLGTYEDKNIAAYIYDEAAKLLFGEFASTNQSLGLLPNLNTVDYITKDEIYDNIAIYLYKNGIYAEDLERTDSYKNRNKDDLYLLKIKQNNLNNQNSFNRNIHGFIGIVKPKNGKQYQVHITYENKNLSFGLYDNKNIAAYVYDEAASLLFSDTNIQTNQNMGLLKPLNESNLITKNEILDIIAKVFNFYKIDVNKLSIPYSEKIVLLELMDKSSNKTNFRMDYKKINSKTGLKGVFTTRSDKMFVTNVSFHNKTLVCGTYEDKNIAGYVYDELSKILYGKDALTNQDYGVLPNIDTLDQQTRDYIYERVHYYLDYHKPHIFKYKPEIYQSDNSNDIKPLNYEIPIHVCDYSYRNNEDYIRLSPEDQKIVDENIRKIISYSIRNNNIMM